MTFEVTLLDDAAPGGDLLADRSTGRTARRVPRHGRGHGRRRRPAQGRARSTTGARCRSSHSAADDDRIILGYRCANSRMTLAVGVDHDIDDRQRRTREHISADDDTGKMVYRVDAEPGKPIRLTKIVTYHTSAGCRRASSSTGAAAPWTGSGTAGHRRQQYADQRAVAGRVLGALRRRGRRPARGPAGGPLEPVPARPGHRPGPSSPACPAKGVTGSGYGGHYFWDTEIYVLPFLTYTSPADGAQRAAVPLQHARRGPPPGRGAGPGGRAVPVAHDQRRGGLAPTTRPAPRSTTSTPTSPTR